LLLFFGNVKETSEILTFKNPKTPFCMELVPLLIQLASGAVGGNLAGKLLPKNSLGTIGNSIAGIAGGALGGQLLGMLGMGGDAAAATDLSGIVQNLAGGGAGGGALMAIIGVVKGMLKK
jgi:uncharacterized membrane protein YeaQ/YmgE (transglycosylase-associated protein family)